MILLVWEDKKVLSGYAHDGKERSILGAQGVSMFSFGSSGRDLISGALEGSTASTKDGYADQRSFRCRFYHNPDE